MNKKMKENYIKEKVNWKTIKKIRQLKNIRENERKVEKLESK